MCIPAGPAQGGMSLPEWLSLPGTPFRVGGSALAHTAQLSWVLASATGPPVRPPRPLRELEGLGIVA